MIINDPRKDNEFAVCELAGIDPEAQYVDKQEYCRLLTSRHKLRRMSPTDENLVGLIDDESGKQFLIHRGELFSA